MAEKTKIVWRERFNNSAVRKMEEMGTLPREETKIEVLDMDGEEVAAAIAESRNREDCEQFARGGEIVILEPAELAGTYRIEVEYDPRFTAFEQDMD